MYIQRKVLIQLGFEGIFKKIETMRKELINTAFKHWITSPKTLHISQELEKLLENWLFFRREIH
ncbi:aspartyl-phosphate phosphatase Spo0E family protein [Peribacillus frigoritolerans]|uniref:aspartyl-phosphate phosphatase Spo0E family protein n=1 Tax=Peribacillus frigoritolerans TaxID=450367 RepID=UPI00292F8D7C|nr:aspartyl-phosphate phosphatase Spo0E family protein [Peribacillus frigoritolerans]